MGDVHIIGVSKNAAMVDALALAPWTARQQED